MSDRLTPFGLVFDAALIERFAAIREELAAAGHPAGDRDAFVLMRSAVSLLHEFDPDGDLGAEVSGLVSFVHAAYRYWLEGENTVALGPAQLDAVLQGRFERVRPPAACYLQLPGRRLWGRSLAEQPFEPLDGLFVLTDGNQLQLIAIFGLQPGRDGFTMVEASGSPPGSWNPLPPDIPGAPAAGLVDIRGPDDLLSLAHNVFLVGGPNEPRSGSD